MQRPGRGACSATTSRPPTTNDSGGLSPPPSHEFTQPGPTSRGPAILFLSGASGAGKTALVSAVRTRSHTGEVRFFHFNSIGVPSPEVGGAEASSPAGWQEESTHQWIERIVADDKDAALVVIEGSSDLRFVEDAFASFQVAAGYRIRRLTEDRKQPELVTRRMNSWARHLHDQARRMGVTVLDTSGQTFEQSLDALEKEIERLSEDTITENPSPNT